MSGVAVARWALGGACPALETLTLVDAAPDAASRPEVGEILADQRVDAAFGDQPESALAPRYPLGVISPGIAPGSDLFNLAVSRCDEVISEVELAFRVSRHRWIAITGTNGKTTTTSLVCHILNEAGVPAVAAGNIGYAALEAALTVPESTVIVAEVSSFQLATTSRFHPEVACVLNITPDHLYWHGSIERYAADKCRVFANQTAGDLALRFVGDDLSERYVAPAVPQAVSVAEVYEPGVTPATPASAGHPHLQVVNGELTYSSGEEYITWGSADALPIKGAHNWVNALFAAAIATYFGVEAQTVQRAMRTFAPVAHRLELVAQIDGTDYFNDSKATNPDATLKAIDAFPGRAVHLMLGGRGKGGDLTELARYCEGRVATVTCFGESGPAFLDAFKQVASPIPISFANTMVGALEIARTAATPGSVVLLSPACASFDEFDSFAHRGEVFARAVVGGRP